MIEPASSPRAYVTPSLYEDLRSCRLRVSFASRGRGGVGGPASWLGDICHGVLEDAVRDRWVLGEDLEGHAVSSWARALEDELMRLREAGVPEEQLRPGAWPGHELKRARLLSTLRRLRELLSGLPASTEILCEESFTARGGRLRGRPDLVVRSGEVHFVLDYKTGRIAEEGESLRERYRRQLQLYAVLEAEATGSWPGIGEVLPLDGPPVAIEILPGECSEVADDAVRVLEDYNACVPGPQPPTVGPDSCPVCDFSASCPALWSAIDVSFQSYLLAVRGMVEEATSTPLGGVTLRIRVGGGSVTEPEVTVRNIDTADHPAAAEAGNGDEVVLVGLRREPGRPTLRLSLRGTLTIVPQRRPGPGDPPATREAVA